jgi:hypothetical protein
MVKNTRVMAKRKIELAFRQSDIHLVGPSAASASQGPLITSMLSIDLI